jgi:hypothetical protein
MYILSYKNEAPRPASYDVVSTCFRGAESATVKSRQTRLTTSDVAWQERLTFRPKEDCP